MSTKSTFQRDLDKQIAHLERTLQHYVNHAPDERLLYCYTYPIWEKYFKLCKERRSLTEKK